MYAEEIKTARETAAKAITAAHQFAAEIRTAKAENKSFGEIDEKFNRAYGDFTAAQAEVARLEKLESTEEQYAKLHAPAAQRAMKAMGVDGEEFGKFWKESFRTYLNRGEAYAQAKLAAGPKEAHALLGSQDDLGGFLVPEDFRAEVIKDMAGFAVFRNLGCRVVPTSRNQVVFPTIRPNSGSSPNPNMYSSNLGGSWRNEGAQGTDGSAPETQNQPTFGQLRIPVHIWQPDAVVVTQEFLEDSAVPVDSILAELFAETKALDEDYSFINGTGVDRPQGILNAGLTAVNSGGASTLKYSGIVDLFTALPAQYRQSAAWLMNSATYGAILKLESTGGFLLFPPNALPGTLMGKQVFFSEFMPDVAASAKPIAFGAWRYYVIAERTEFRITRLVERFAPNVGLLATARLGGQVVRNNAFRLQNIST